MAVGGRDEWRRSYDRLEELLPQVEAFAADRARLEALNALLHEYGDARDKIKEARIHEAELSKSRWEAACKELLPGDSPKLNELVEFDREDSRLWKDRFEIENSELMIQLKESANRVENNENPAAQLNEDPADHDHTVRDLRAEIRKLKHAYETLCSNKDDDIQRLQAEALAAKSKLLLAEGKLDEMHSVAKEKHIQKLKDGQPRSLKRKSASLAKKKDIQKLKDGQPKSLVRKRASLPNETCQKRRRDTNEMHLEQGTIVSYQTDYAYEGNRTAASPCREKKRINDSVADDTLPVVELPQKRSKNDVAQKLGQESSSYIVADQNESTSDTLKMQRTSV